MFNFSKKNKPSQDLVDSVAAEIEKEAASHLRFFELSSIIFSLEGRLYPERIPNMRNKIAELYMIWESAHNKINSDPAITAEMSYKSFSKKMKSRKML
jgi:hypothetical protein